MAKRKRIITKKISQNIETDPYAYVVNNASVQTRKLKSEDVGFFVTIYGDKHYILRFSSEDDSGKRREGISIKETVDLIFRSIKHIIYYIFKENSFNPINFPTSTERKKRIVLVNKIDIEEDLNVVVEIHFDSIDVYEFTIITAMKIDNFNIADGQFYLEFYKENSILKQFVRKEERIVDRFDN
ncbi:hypothetical protein [Myroides sp. N17-2]|uniref:hypothetical protein n=1 Tax=Myroides sp. N17-2 TaxID=2030799 RepID=UPI000EFD30EB|nr:hypothetical protein [Myroides sp. N17-2]